MTIAIKRKSGFVDSQIPLNVAIGDHESVRLDSTHEEVTLSPTEASVELEITNLFTKKQKVTATNNDRIIISNSLNLMWAFISFFVLLILINVFLPDNKVYWSLLLLVVYGVAIKFLVPSFNIERQTME
ncbi:hypothetical protein [Bavariicoccus seileri]|uniref:hypothetical protein n=1 Tax=Bavariicoccus seileri TaxID=549685 RepID=UPI0003B2E3ED|nr:hypothetical protein [Bavariicoccus seileri]